MTAAAERCARCGMLAHAHLRLVAGDPEGLAYPSPNLVDPGDPTGLDPVFCPPETYTQGASDG